MHIKIKEQSQFSPVTDFRRTNAHPTWHWIVRHCAPNFMAVSWKTKDTISHSLEQHLDVQLRKRMLIFCSTSTRSMIWNKWLTVVNFSNEREAGRSAFSSVFWQNQPHSRCETHCKSICFCHVEVKNTFSSELCPQFFCGGFSLHVDQVFSQEWDMAADFSAFFARHKTIPEVHVS